MSPVNADRPELVSAAAELLIATSARLSRLEDAILAELPVPLTYRQHRLLTRIGAGHTSVVVLASFGNLTLPTVSESISVMVRRGLVTRSEDPSDRRLSLIELTPLGREACEVATAKLRGQFELLVPGVSKAELRSFSEVLQGVFDRATEYFKGEGTNGSKRASKN